MSKFLRTLPVHFRRAFYNIKRNFASTLSSAFAVMITSTLISVFLICAFNVDLFAERIEDTIRIAVRIEDGADKDKIKSELEDLKDVYEVNYSSKEEQLEDFIDSDQGGEKYRMFEDDNPMYATYFVDISDPNQFESVATAAGKLEGVKDTSYGGTASRDIVNIFNNVRIGGAALVGALSLLAIFLISNTIKININNRKDEIGIMRNVGASNWFIKIPFLIEGMLIGVIGSIIPILATIFGYGFLYSYAGGQFFTSILKLYAPAPFVYQISLVLLGVGIVVGLLGSLLSVNKYLKWKR